ncbi:uncharacterized protein VP01_3424g1, partial [Puccinia sorghi]
MVTKERTQILAMEETLRQTWARLDTQQPRSNKSRSRTQPGQARQTPTLQQHLRHGCQECFPTDASKVAFATSFMRDYAATWCQLYLNRIFKGEPLDWTDFLKDLE